VFVDNEFLNTLWIISSLRSLYLIILWISLPDDGYLGRVKIAKHVITRQYAAVKIVPKQALVNSRMSLTEAGAKNDKQLLGIEVNPISWEAERE
jgi:hypothetical protein